MLGHRQGVLLSRLFYPKQHWLMTSNAFAAPLWRLFFNETNDTCLCEQTQRTLKWVSWIIADFFSKHRLEPLLGQMWPKSQPNALQLKALVSCDYKQQPGEMTQVLSGLIQFCHKPICHGLSIVLYSRTKQLNFLARCQNPTTPVSASVGLWTLFGQIKMIITECWTSEAE